MKHFIWLVAFIGIATTTQAQDFEPMRQHIKKKKYKYCTSSRTYINKESKEAGIVHQYGTWTFNEQGQVLAYVKYDDAGKTSVKGENTYNEQGNISLTSENNLHINEQERIVYTYDEQGRLLSKIDYRDQKLIVTYQHYYSNGLLRDSTVWLDKNDKPELIEYYKYNEKGWLIEQSEQTDYGRADGKTIFEYHANGTLKDEILYDGFGNIFERIYYNEVGLLLKKEVSYIDYEIVYEYTYDKKGLLSSYTKTQSNLPKYEVYNFSWSKKIP